MELEEQAVYGPIWSRRFGWDIGINLLPCGLKLCTFECLYCQYGFAPPPTKKKLAFPKFEEITIQWEEQLRIAARLGIEIRHTTFSGNGEPTMYPRFAELAEKLIDWRNEKHPEIKLAVLTNGYRLRDARIRKALSLFDEPILKLDCAIPVKFQQLNGPREKISLRRYVENLKRCKKVIIQTMFVHGWNDEPEDLKAWHEALREIQPLSVQIYTVTRDPALRGLVPLSKHRLVRIAAEASSTTHLPVRAFY
jgi:wyosine [tRNA(Phe)-imidazoG37] synthetase (radical SAM superfamily)